MKAGHTPDLTIARVCSLVKGKRGKFKESCGEGGTLRKIYAMLQLRKRVCNWAARALEDWPRVKANFPLYRKPLEA